MAEGFEIAEGFVSVKAEIDKRQINSSAVLAGASAGQTIIKSVGDNVKRDGKSVLAGAFTESFGSALKTGMTGGLSILGTLNASLGKNPYVAGFGVALGTAIAVTAAPAIGAALSGALIGGAGLGVIGLGAVLLKEEPAVKKAATRLSETVKTTFTKAAKPLAKPFVDALGVFDRLVKDIGPDLKQMFADVAPAVKPLAEGLSGFVKEMLPGLKDLVKESGPFLTEFAKSLPGLGESLSKFFTLVSEGGPGASLFFKDFLGFLGFFIVNMGAVIGWLSKGYVALRDFFLSIPGWVETGKQKFQEIWDRVTGFFSDVWTKASELPDKVKNAILSLPSKVREVLDSLFNSATYNIGVGLGNIVKFFAGLPGRAWSAISSLPSRIGSVFTSARTSASNTASGLVGSVVSFLRGLPDKARNAISGLPGKVKGVVSGAGKWLYSAGKDIIRGLANGIQDMMGWAVDRAKSAARNIAQGFKDALGISSPSKLMAEEVGRWIPPGIAEGVNQAMPTAQQSINSATRSMAATAIAPANSSTPAASSGMSIQQLVINIKALLDPTDPASFRRTVAELDRALTTYRKSYA